MTLARAFTLQESLPMAKRTKKAKSVGRFGARYGVRIRRRIREIETRQKAAHVCPQCRAPKVRRIGTGIWACRKCAYKFAGGAYFPSTPAARTFVEKEGVAVAGRPVIPDAGGLVEEELVEEEQVAEGSPEPEA